MRIALFLAVSATCLWPLGASASWQYTKWGMTPKQVQTASKNAATEASQEDIAGHRANDGSIVPKLTAPYSTGTFSFKALFGFDPNDKLINVELDLVDGNPHELIGALRNKYGKPVSEPTDSTMRTWMWNTSQDKVTALMIGEHLSLYYSPLHDTNEHGL